MASIGVEPIRPYGHWILSPTRLPIPPRGRYLILARKTEDFISVSERLARSYLIRFHFARLEPDLRITPKAPHYLRGAATSAVVFNGHSKPFNSPRGFQAIPPPFKRCLFQRDRLDSTIQSMSDNGLTNELWLKRIRRNRK